MRKKVCLLAVGLLLCAGAVSFPWQAAEAEVPSETSQLNLFLRFQNPVELTPLMELIINSLGQDNSVIIGALNDLARTDQLIGNTENWERYSFLLVYLASGNLPSSGSRPLEQALRLLPPPSTAVRRAAKACLLELALREILFVQEMRSLAAEIPRQRVQGLLGGIEPAAETPDGLEAALSRSEYLIMLVRDLELRNEDSLFYSVYQRVYYPRIDGLSNVIDIWGASENLTEVLVHITMSILNREMFVDRDQDSLFSLSMVTQRIINVHQWRPRVQAVAAEALREILAQLPGWIVNTNESIAQRDAIAASIEAELARRAPVPAPPPVKGLERDISPAFAEEQLSINSAQYLARPDLS